jgi:hypothetical protein
MAGLGLMEDDRRPLDPSVAHAVTDFENKGQSPQASSSGSSGAVTAAVTAPSHTAR